jgi:hypothetical protein
MSGVIEGGDQPSGRFDPPAQARGQIARKVPVEANFVAQEADPGGVELGAFAEDQAGAGIKCRDEVAHGARSRVLNALRETLADQRVGLSVHPAWHWVHLLLQSAAVGQRSASRAKPAARIAVMVSASVVGMVGGVPPWSVGSSSGTWWMNRPATRSQNAA